MAFGKESRQDALTGYEAAPRCLVWIAVGAIPTGPQLGSGSMEGSYQKEFQILPMWPSMDGSEIYQMIS